MSIERILRAVGAVLLALAAGLSLGGAVTRSGWGPVVLTVTALCATWQSTRFIHAVRRGEGTKHE